MATLSQALKQAYAAANKNTIILHTLEINHKSFTESARVARWPVIDNEPRVFHLRLEEDAPYNPGQIVDFIGVPFDIVPPSSSTDSVGEFQIKVDNVGDTLDEHLESAALHGTQISAIYREYILKPNADEEDISVPASVTSGIKISNPRLEGQTLTFSGVVLGWTRRPYGYLYTASGYPGLVRGR